MNARTPRPWWQGLLALLALHALCVLPMPWEGVTADSWWAQSLGAWPGALAALHADLPLAVGLALALAAVGWRRLAMLLGACVLVASVLAHGATSLVPLVYERPYTTDDLKLLPALWYLLTHDKPAWNVAVDVLAAVGALAAAVAVVATLTAVLLGVVRARGRAGVGAALALAAAAATTVWPSPRLHGSTLWLLVHSAPGPTPGGLHAATNLAEAAPPVALQGIDVQVLFVESYGRAAARQPELDQRLHRLWDEVAAAGPTTGFAVASAWYAPRTYGGGSHLAHMELLTGVPIPDEATFQALLAPPIDPSTPPPRTLPRVLHDLGHHAIDAQPCMYVAWPQGRALYGFDEDVFQAEFGYQGHDYPWGRIPDQFSLHHLLPRANDPARTPWFLMFVGVSSHAPFSAIPPYVADWSTVDAERVWPPATVHRLSFADFVHHRETLGAYADALEYSLRSALGYVQQLRRPSLVFVLGDHQPPMGFALPVADSSRDVPVHALSNRPELLARLCAHGWRAGFDAGDAAARPLASFALDLVQAMQR